MKATITQCFIAEDRGFSFQIAEASDHVFDKGRWFWFHVGKFVFSFFVMWDKQ